MLRQRSRVCVVCGAIGIGRKTKYCSEECSVSAAKAAYEKAAASRIPPTPYEIVCAGCGIPVLAHSANRKYCNKQCRVKAYAPMAKVSRHANPIPSRANAKRQKLRLIAQFRAACRIAAELEMPIATDEPEFWFPADLRRRLNEVPKIRDTVRMLDSEYKRYLANIVLEHSPWQSDGNIARLIGLTSSTVHKHRNRLETLGLIEPMRHQFSTHNRDAAFYERKDHEASGLRYVTACWFDGKSTISISRWIRPNKDRFWPDHADVNVASTLRRRLEHERLALIRAFQQTGLLQPEDKQYAKPA